MRLKAETKFENLNFSKVVPHQELKITLTSSPSKNQFCKARINNIDKFLRSSPMNVK